MKSIDPEVNGYVTLQELDDILKMIFCQLHDKDLTGLLNQFTDPINQVLILYRDFYTAIEKSLKQ